MILVDTSAWIDYFQNRRTEVSARVARALGTSVVAVGDLILTELLQGVRHDRDLARMIRALSSMKRVDLCGLVIAEQGAANYRLLRRRGITVRGTIDVIIATWCIANCVSIVHNDRDLAVMERELGLVSYAA